MKPDSQQEGLKCKLTSCSQLFAKGQLGAEQPCLVLILVPKRQTPTLAFKALAYSRFPASKVLLLL